MNSAIQTLTAEMEQAINRMKHISADHSQILLTLKNSAARKELYDQFEAERSRFFMAYGQERSFRLEALNEGLFREFNQYLIDCVNCIDEIHKSPTFIEYLFIE